MRREKISMNEMKYFNAIPFFHISFNKSDFIDRAPKNTRIEINKPIHIVEIFCQNVTLTDFPFPSFTQTRITISDGKLKGKKWRKRNDSDGKSMSEKPLCKRETI